LREFFCILSERFAIVDARLSDNREIYSLLGSETGGAKQVVARKTFFCRCARCLFDRLSLGHRFD
jgi:hypothetical protein